MTFDLIVTGGLVVDRGVIAPRDLVVKDGRIVAQLEPGGGLTDASGTIDAHGLWILPGALDAHFHAGDTLGTGTSFPESVRSASIQAACGGVTTILPYVWGLPKEPVAELVDRYIKYIAAESILDFTLHVGVRPDMALIRQLPEAFDRGVTSFKFHMDYRKSGGGRMTDDDHRTVAMSLIGKHGGLAMFHAENGYIVDALEDMLIAEGKTSWEWFLHSRPVEAETLAITTVTSLGRLLGCEVYIPHLSSADGLEVIEDARRHGAVVFAETCAQYLLLTNDDLGRQGSLVKVGPPLRFERDRQALWDGVRRGSIDTLASDQSAWPLEKKRESGDDFFKAIFGIPVIEEMFPLLLTQALSHGAVSVHRLVDAFCERPARIFGLYPRKGTLQVGADADFILVDPEATWRLEARSQHGIGWTPFEGWDMKGRVVATYQRGREIQRGGVVRERIAGEYLMSKRVS